MNAPRTICVKCLHHRNRDGIALVHQCGHPALKRRQGIDPVTDKVRYRVSARLRINFPSYEDQVHPDCDEINDGECPFYEEKA